jgi:hypothetical protein
VSSFATADNGRALWEALLALSGYFLCFFFPWWTLPLWSHARRRALSYCQGTTGKHRTPHGAPAPLASSFDKKQQQGQALEFQVTL